ncbi:21990_t:CDS:2 [Entrophospora sp. SA101]|nr:21984_t:CDS:2 [Entrophospora sp. SA101]CAJ0912573.1 21990_t:CDS:2 [Entrophospora sp. SA101]
MPLTFTSCQFGNLSSDSTKWNLISVNPSQPLSSSSEIFIESFDNKLCLNTKSNSGVEACPCINDDVNQKWKFNLDGSFSSSSNDGKCLTVIDDVVVGLDTCQSNSTPMTWKTYNVAPNTINVYTNTLFRGNFTQLTVNTYTPKDLPKEIFSSPFSLEIPPGLLFVAESDNNNKNSIIYSSDIAQGLKPWHIILIVILILLILLIVIIVAALLIRKSNIKKRQTKIDNFKEAYDENKVQKQMRNLYDIAPRLVKNNDYKISPLKKLEPTYSSKQAQQKLRRSSTMGSVNRKARCYFENNNYDDFEIIVADKGIKTSPHAIFNEDYHTGGNDLS